MSNENENQNLIGEPSFGGSQKTRRNWDNANWTIKADQPNVYRILPPFGSLAKSGKWSQYESVIWGFKGTNGKQKPFRSILRKSKGMIQQNDPAVSWIEKQVLLRNKTIESLKSEGKTKDQIEKAVQPLTEFTQQFRVEKFHYVNVMRQDRVVGKLKLKISAKKALDTLFKRLLEEEKVNPISVSEGVWVDFRKSGEGLQTQYTCDVVYDVISENGRKLKVLRPAALTEQDLEKMKTDAFDLTLSYKDLTFDEIDRLVKSSADPEIVDSVFGTPKTAALKEAPSFEDSGDSDGEEMDVLSQLSTASPSTNKKVPAGVASFLDV